MTSKRTRFRRRRLAREWGAERRGRSWGPVPGDRLRLVGWDVSSGRDESAMVLLWEDADGDRVLFGVVGGPS